MEAGKKLRVMLVDEHKIVCQGLSEILARETGIDVVAEANDGIEALRLARETSPDLMIVAVSLPGMSGIEVTRRVAENMPHTSVLILTMREEKKFLLEALAAGARGYLLKDCTSTDLVAAIRGVCEGGTYLSQKVAGLLAKEYIRQPREQSGPASVTLTPREKEVLQLIAEGKNNRQIASLLDVSAKTVETWRKKLMKKLNLNSLAELVKYAIREGLVPIEE